MQKKIIALALATLAGSAFAQSNVTIYGIADMGYKLTDKDGKKNQSSIDSGILSTSRIGFKGVEDLGNGLKALFTLEYGLTVDDNTGVGATYDKTGTLVGNARQQFVGLTSGFGTVVAGRLQTTGLDFTVAGTALGGSIGIGITNVVATNSPVGSPTSLISAASRANNAVAYISPSFGGVTLAYNHARMSETAATDNTADNSANLLSASYANGPITAGAVWAKQSLEKGASVDDVKEWGLRGGYDFGVAKLQATYQTLKTDAASNKDKKYVFSLTVPVSAKVAVIGEYAKRKNEILTTSATDETKGITLAATYSLSKRTTAYAGYVNLNPEGSSNNTNVYAAGLRHSF